MDQLAQKWHDDVAEFHRAMGVPTVTKFTPKQAGLRAALIVEEVRELSEASNLFEIADALVDLQYVTVGIPVMLGRSFDLGTSKADPSGPLVDIVVDILGHIQSDSESVIGCLIRNDNCGGLHQSIFSLTRSILNLSRSFRLPFADLWDEVHAANMRKVGGPKCPDTGKQLKPEGWTKPDIEGVLRKHGLTAENLK